MGCYFLGLDIYVCLVHLTILPQCWLKIFEDKLEKELTRVFRKLNDACCYLQKLIGEAKV